ncbi:MAG: DUF4340 domain-containing protein [Acidobacteriota bacterium]
MKPKTLLFLFILTGGLGLFVASVERDMLSTDERREAEKMILGAVEIDQIEALALSGEGFADTIRLARDGVDGSWRLTAPIDAPADADAVRSLLDRLLALEKTRTFESIDAAQLGLDDPRLRLVVETTVGEHPLRVGADLPLGDGAIVSGSDSTVAWAVPLGDLVDGLGRTTTSWRDRRLFRSPQQAIARLVVESGDTGRVVLDRSDGDRFALRQPLADLADQATVDGLIASLAGLEATAFAADDGTEPSAFQANARIEVTLDGHEQPWRIEWSQPTTGPTPADALGTSPAARARLTAPDSAPRLVDLDASALVRAAERTADAWRSRAWTNAQVFQIDRAMIALADTTPIELVREDGVWFRDGVEVEYTAASDVLYPPTETRAERLIEPNAATTLGHRLTRPRLVLTLDVGDDRQILSLFDAIDDLAAATLDGRDAVLLIPAADADSLVAAIEALRDAPVASEADD